jgi:hypothetical protein
MSAYKQFLASDIIIAPFEVNKSFYYEGAAALTSSYVGIDRYLGVNITTSNFDSATAPTTGQVDTQYQQLVYRSIEELYYSNYLNLSSSYGSPVNTASIFPGEDTAGDVLVGGTSSAGRYFNYPQTSLTFAKSFPTESNAEIAVISIPSKLFGNYIQPGSFRFTTPSGSIYDDGEGNLYYSTTDTYCGNIFYPHGLAIVTVGSQSAGAVYGTAIYGTSTYGGATTNIIQDVVTSPNVTCSFSSSLTIYETQYKCTISENEFNVSLNPSILTSGSTDVLAPYCTSSYFSPYITTIGLYNEAQQLLAIGKLAQPLPTSPTTDTTILINIDR